jgi:hypothetical protein
MFDEIDRNRLHILLNNTGFHFRFSYIYIHFNTHKGWCE